jgi:hypothetical protein
VLRGGMRKALGRNAIALGASDGREAPRKSPLAPSQGSEAMSCDAARVASLLKSLLVFMTEVPFVLRVAVQPDVMEIRLG